MQQYLGSFRTKESAAIAYNKRAVELFDKPKLNVVNISTIDISDTNVKVRKGESAYRGVSPYKNRWKTFAQKDKIMQKGGSWMTQEEAALAYNFLAAKLFENARLNEVTVLAAKNAREKAYEAFFKTNETIPRGVERKGEHFTARKQEAGRTIRIGKFNTAKEASAAYRKDWMTNNHKMYDEQMMGFSIDMMT